MNLNKMTAEELLELVGRSVWEIGTYGIRERTIERVLVGIHTPLRLQWRGDYCDCWAFGDIYLTRNEAIIAFNARLDAKKLEPEAQDDPKI